MANLIAAESNWQEHGNPATLQVINVVYKYMYICTYVAWTYVNICISVVMYVDVKLKMHKSANIHLLLWLKRFYGQFCCFF